MLMVLPQTLERKQHCFGGFAEVDDVFGDVMEADKVDSIGSFTWPDCAI